MDNKEFKAAVERNLKYFPVPIIYGTRDPISEGDYLDFESLFYTPNKLLLLL